MCGVPWNDLNLDVNIGMPFAEPGDQFRHMLPLRPKRPERDPGPPVAGARTAGQRREEGERTEECPDRRSFHAVPRPGRNAVTRLRM